MNQVGLWEYFTSGYVFVQDGRLLNAEIIREAYGFAYTRFPFERMEKIRRVGA